MEHQISDNLEARFELSNSVCRNLKGYFFYDGRCVCCVFLARKLKNKLWKQGYVLMPAQAPWARVRLGLKANQRPGQATLMLADGQTLRGFDALAPLGHDITSIPVMAGFLKSAFGTGLTRKLYRVWTGLRHRFFPRCELVDVHREGVEIQRNALLR